MSPASAGRFFTTEPPEKLEPSNSFSLRETLTTLGQWVSPGETRKAYCFLEVGFRRAFLLFLLDRSCGSALTWARALARWTSAEMEWYLHGHVSTGP